jgi:hypothetical protein
MFRSTPSMVLVTSSLPRENCKERTLLAFVHGVLAGDQMNVGGLTRNVLEFTRL